MPITRRDLFRGAGLVLGAAGASALLAACGTGAPAGAPVANTSPAAAVRGGVLRTVFGGGGAAESLDPFGGIAPIDFVRNDVIYESLYVLQGNEPVPALAQSLDVAADGRSFVLHLRPEVRWHDGSLFTADDVAYSFQYMSSLDRPYPSQLQTYFDFAKLEVRDANTLYVPALSPIGDPALMLAAFPGKMIKNGATAFTVDSAVGTGPYRVAAFEAGREARLERFDGYWGGAAPADELVFVSLADPQATVNAIATGQADYTGDIPFTTAKTGAPGADLEIRTAGPDYRTGFAFVLNATRAPFNDPRVRKAVRLAIDRQALVDTVLLGYGAPGNDLFGAGAKYHSDRPALPRDLDQARQLLREAGAEGAVVTVRSTEFVIGYNASTQMFAEQMKEIGLDVRPQIVGLGEFFEPTALAEANAITFSIGNYPLAVAYGRLAGVPSLALPDVEFTDTLGRAMAATDEATRAQAWAALQDVMAERGNTVVWGLADVLSLARKNVTGIEIHTEAKYPYLGKAGLA